MGQYPQKRENDIIFSLFTEGNVMGNTVLDYLKLDCDGNAALFYDEAQTVSRAQFIACAKSVGTYLCSAVEPGHPVAVLCGRHAHTPCCFLGAVEAGCFYAPMDPSMPAARLDQILGVIKAPVMLTDRENYDLAASLDFDGKIAVFEDISDTEISETALANAQKELREDRPLYVIFTSGSSGVPKGVVTSHRSVMNYIDAVCSVLHISPSDVLGSQAPLDYIAAIRDIYIPLKTGCSAVIIPKAQFAMPNALFRTLNLYKVTTLCWSVAGMEVPYKLNGFSQLRPEYVTKVLFSGAVMPGKCLRVWQQNLPGALFVNQYGPTECTASCTYYTVPRLVEEDEVLPIGRPYQNYGILLLNEDNTPTAPGEQGEICVTGCGLALGYYGDEERTAQSFIQNPLNRQYRELIYKTGDIGSLNENGELEFHGRKDRQIKYMGHRVELDEVEKTALQLDGIDECCAMYQSEREMLYLFYTGTADTRTIALFFRQRLPGFMAPRKTVKLDELPRLPNGKTDMQSLKKYYK